MGTDFSTIEDLETAFQEIARLNYKIYELEQEKLNLRIENKRLAFQIVDLQAELSIPKFISIATNE